MSGAQWPEPFWSGGPAATLTWSTDAPGGGSVNFQAKLIQPDGARSVGARERLPLIFYFAGLGSCGGMDHWDTDSLARIAPVSFVLVAPFRQKGYWWTIADDREWGWVDGDFAPQVVQLLVDWMRALGGQPGIDGSKMAALGFSAGAYAITEILAHGEAPLKSVLIGGVHGHSQPDMEGICGKRAKRADDIASKWRAYTDRLRNHGGAPHGIIGVHDRGDQVCPWRYAEEIYDLLDRRQQQLRCRPVELKELSIPRTRKNKSLHNYHNLALEDPELFGRLLAQVRGEDPAAPAGSAEAGGSGAGGQLAAARKRRREGSPEPDSEALRQRHEVPEMSRWRPKPRVERDAAEELEEDARREETPWRPATEAAGTSRSCQESSAPPRPRPRNPWMDDDRKDDAVRECHGSQAAVPVPRLEEESRRPWLQESSAPPRRRRSPWAEKDREGGGALRRTGCEVAPAEGMEEERRASRHQDSAAPEAERRPAGSRVRPLSGASGRPAAAGTSSWTASAVAPVVHAPPEQRAAPLAVQPLRGATGGAGGVGRSGDRVLFCANPRCWFQVHSDPEFGGFCCRKCHWCFATGSKTKKQHGQRCERREPPQSAPRADQIPPEQPMAT